MPSADSNDTEIFVTYFLEHESGLYDKKGPIIKETDNTIVFKTQSTKYRIIDEKYIERKQHCGWYRLGEIENISTRSASQRYLYD